MSPSKPLESWSDTWCPSAAGQPGQALPTDTLTCRSEKGGDAKGLAGGDGRAFGNLEALQAPPCLSLFGCKS